MNEFENQEVVEETVVEETPAVVEEAKVEETATEFEAEETEQQEETQEEETVEEAAEEQPSEYKSTLPEAVVRCFEAYGADNYVDFIGSEYVERMPWTPLYTWSNNLSYDTPEGLAWQQIGECKHKWLPQLVTSRDFDKSWKQYMDEYAKCNPELFIAAAQEEVYNRLNDALSRGWSI